MSKVFIKHSVLAVHTVLVSDECTFNADNQ